MVSNDTLVYSLLNIQTQLTQRTLTKRFRAIQLNILNTTITTPCNLTVVIKIISNQLLELLPLLLLLIKQLLVLVRPFPLLKLQQKLLSVLNNTDFGNVSHWSIIKIVLLILLRLQIFYDGVPKLHVDLQVKRLLQSRLDQLLIRSHLVLLYALNHPSQALHT